MRSLTVAGDTVIIVSTRVTVTVLARGIRSVQPVVGVQRGQVMMMMVMRQAKRQMWVASAGPVCAQSQVPGSWTGRPIVVAAVASVAAARVGQVVVQRGQRMVVQVVTVAVRLDRSRNAAAQNVVDHEARAGRLKDRHGAALNWHRHLPGRGATGAELGQSANL